MTESPRHYHATRLIEAVLLEWVRRTGGDAVVGSNIALRWDRGQPKVGVDPGVYLVEPVPPGGEAVKSLCTWKRGHATPRVAAEVVSEGTAAKDCTDGPERYATSGTHELWVFDPFKLGPAVGVGPHVLQVWRRTPRGRFGRVYAGDGPARTVELGARLMVTDGGSRLRLADDEAGERLWPTETERERTEKEAALRKLEGTPRRARPASAAVARRDPDKLWASRRDGLCSAPCHLGCARASL